MGVYIKNMKMPGACLACDFCNPFAEEPYCRRLMKITPKTTTLPDCPLVSVPPHGRLIVEDDAIETAWMILAGIGYRREENPQLEQTVREVYATAPTIEVE